MRQAFQKGFVMPLDSDKKTPHVKVEHLGQILFSQGLFHHDDYCDFRSFWLRERSRIS